MARLVLHFLNKKYIKILDFQKLYEGQSLSIESAELQRR